jgi:hypothetical protein
VWTSTDPADEMWNAYSYCGGNPILFYDPNGSEVDETTYGENSNLSKSCEAAVDNSYLASKINSMINSSYIYSDIDFEGMADPGYSSFFATIMPNEDYGIGQMKNITGYANNIAWLFPPSKVPVALINTAFTLGDWGWKLHESSEIPFSTIGQDVVSYGVGKITGVTAKSTLGKTGEQVISNVISRSWDESSKAIMNASRKSEHK